MTELCEIARRYGTDKYDHGYTQYYWESLAHLKEKRIRILEIGVAAGNSIRMWREFFPNACIYGIDKNKKTMHIPGVELHTLDQASVISWKQFIRKSKAKFDFVVDDGGHTMKQQITSFKCLFPHLKSNGIYAIEDLHTSYHEDWGGGYNKKFTTANFLKGLLNNVLPFSLKGKAFLKRHNGKSWKPRKKKYQIKSIHFYPKLAIIVKI